MSRLALTLLGPPVVTIDGSPVGLKRRKALALLAYLAATAQTQTRDALAEMLYPGHAREQAYSDFRQTLTMLRRAIGAEWLVTDQLGVSLKDSSKLWVDVTEFRRLIREVRRGGKTGGSAGSEKLLYRAAAMVRGTFLSGFSLRDCPEFEEWQITEADVLRRDEAWALERLADLHQSRQEHREAIEVCQTWLSLDTFQESVHRRLMRLYALSGQRSLALRQYVKCRAILEKELGEEPSRETEELHELIVRERLGPESVPRSRSASDKLSGHGSPQIVPFVGRERELALLKAAYEDARAGRGRLVLISGEAGIGKTRLLEEATAGALDRGARVIWGRCYEDAGLPACWPWRQVLGQLAREGGPDRARVWAGRRAEVLRSLVTDLHEVIGVMGEPPRLDNADSERFRLSEAVARFLQAAAEEQTLVLVLDDLHCADSATLGILEFITRGLAGTRLLVLAACRNAVTGPRLALGRTLDKLARERSFERFELDALDRAHVAEMAEKSGQTIVPPGFAEALWERTRGNALFVVESLRFRREGKPEGELPVPPGVRALIRRELHTVSSGCYELLETAAALSAEFTIEKLSSALKLSGQDLLSRVDEAVTARFLLGLPDGVYRFSHPLMREAMYDEMTLSRRTELHARIAQALEDLYGARKERYASELAHHYALAQHLAPAEKLARYSLLAGEHELMERAFEEAVFHFQRGLAAKGPGADDAETAWLRFGLARALPKPTRTTWFEIDNSEDGAGAFAEQTAAFDFFATSHDIDSAIKVATYPLVLVNRRSGETRILATRALQIVLPGSMDESRLMRLSAMFDYARTADYSTFSQRMQHAVGAARRSSDRVLELGIASSLAYASMERSFHDTAKSVAHAQELMREVDDPVSKYFVHLPAYHVALTSGNVGEAAGLAEAMHESAVRIRSDEYLKLALLVRMDLDWVRGNWAGMRAASDEGLAVETDSTLFRQHLAARTHLELEAGDADSGNRWMQRYLAELKRKGLGEDFETSVAAHDISRMARLTGDTDLADLVRKAAAALIRPGQEHLGAAVWANRARAGLAVAAHLLGDRETAARLHQWYAGNDESWKVGLFPTRKRLLGLLDLTLGDAEGAVAELEQTLVDQAPFRKGPIGAWIASELAQALLARAKQGDLERAAALLREGQSSAKRLRMTSLQVRYRQLGARVPKLTPSRVRGHGRRHHR